MFSYKGLKKLIFDEYPYKYYMVRPTQPPVLSYLCFEEPYSESPDENVIWNETKIGSNLQRIYKGEGSVQLIAYYPYARGIKSVSIGYNANGTRVINQGDLPAELEIIYSFASVVNGFTISLIGEERNQSFSVNSFVPVSGDTYLLVNSHTQLLEGLDSNKQKTGNLYNRYILEGDFPQLEPGFTTFSSDQHFVSAEFIPVYY